MKVLTMRRTALACAGLGAIGAISAIAFTGTSALYTASGGAQDNQITNGTVSFNNNGNTATLQLPHNLVPGDNLVSGNQRYYLNYTGTSNAFVGVDMTVVSDAAVPCTALSAKAVGDAVLPADMASCTKAGEQPLFGGPSVSDFNLAAWPGATGGGPLITTAQLAGNMGCKIADVSGKDVVECSSTVKNVLMPFAGNPGYGDASHTTIGNNGNLIWVPGNYSTAPWVSIGGSLASTATNESQGSSTTITLTGHAVQSDNNTSDFGGVRGTCAADTSAPSWAPWTTFVGLGGASAGSVACPGSWA